MIPPEQLALEVLMEKSAFVARKKSTQELERLGDHVHDSIQALEFEDPSKDALLGYPEQACKGSCGQASWSAAPCWATLERWVVVKRMDLASSDQRSKRSENRRSSRLPRLLPREKGESIIGRRG